MWVPRRGSKCLTNERGCTSGGDRGAELCEGRGVEWRRGRAVVRDARGDRKYGCLVRGMVGKRDAEGARMWI